MSTPTDTPVTDTPGGDTVTTTAEIIVIDTITSKQPMLDASHRCDRCGAQAFMEVEVAVIVDDGVEKKEILFCKHHGDMHFDALKVKAVRIIDYRPLAAIKPH